MVVRQTRGSCGGSLARVASCRPIEFAGAVLSACLASLRHRFAQTPGFNQIGCRDAAGLTAGWLGLYARLRCGSSCELHWADWFIICFADLSLSDTAWR